MLVIHDLRFLPDRLRGGGVALGNFDGLHPGHRAVLAAARQPERPWLALTFDPHPREVFRPQDPPFRLMRLADKLRGLRDIGLDGTIVLRFTRDFAAMTATDFIQQILRDGLGVSHVAVGEDFCFGRGREGTVARLAGAGGFSVAAVVPQGDAGAVYSSSAIRQALQNGQPELAAQMLGRPFSLRARVQHGDKRGRTIGFPTANLLWPSLLVPMAGVYAVRVPGLGLGVANLGRRPTVAGTDLRLEVHLFDFSGDLYGQALTVELLRFIRPEQKFTGLEALVKQIALDADTARQLLAAVPA